MSDDISRAAWGKRSNPADHPARRALEMMLEAIERGELDPDHIIAVWGKCGPEQHDFGFFQSGNFRHYEQIGLLQTIVGIMNK